MAIVGVGIDLVSIPDFAEQVDQPGTVFAETFTPGERRDAADKSSSAARHLAARWAAKEAVIKAWSGSRFSKRPVLPEGIHRDIEVITTELVLADLDAVTKRIDKTQKKAKSGDKEAIAEMALLEKLLPHLNAGKTANVLPGATEDECLAECVGEVADQISLISNACLACIADHRDRCLSLEVDCEDVCDQGIDDNPPPPDPTDPPPVVVDAGMPDGF